MATRKDLLKAQAFTSRRMIAAFVNRDPDDPTPPLWRRGGVTRRGCLDAWRLASEPDRLGVPPVGQA